MRLVVYWFTCQLVFMGTVCAFDGLSQESNPDGGHFLYQGFVVSLLFLPLVIFDLIKFSNRFAGPVLNLRNKMNKLADGEEVEDIRFRPGDFYPDLMNNFNTLKKKQARVQDDPTTTDVEKPIECEKDEVLV